MLQFEDELAISIAMVPVDECISERCESGGCSNILVTTGDPNVINTNGTSLIGVTAFVRAECTCSARMFDLGNETVGLTKGSAKCEPHSCLNGGTCTARAYDVV